MHSNVEGAVDCGAAKIGLLKAFMTNGPLISPISFAVARRLDDALRAVRVTQAPTLNGLPSPGAVAKILEGLRRLLFPEIFNRESMPSRPADVSALALQSLAQRLWQQIQLALLSAFESTGHQLAAENLAASADLITQRFFEELPQIKQAVIRDAQAALAGDPAATAISEVILAYPGHYAITAFRLAHALHELGVPLLPRMISEQAHHMTAIDIHPAAQIGDAFFADHGTGVVVGETAVIGNRVRLYQGVTLGALSLPTGRVSELRLGGKRHPTIEDDVVIYAGATILGGATVIGHDSVVGGNCWIIESLPPSSRVSVRTRIDIRPPHSTHSNPESIGS